MITQKELKEYLEYNQTTGDFIWIKKRNLANKKVKQSYCESSEVES